jgi:hypothetical protein
MEVHSEAKTLHLTEKSKRKEEKEDRVLLSFHSDLKTSHYAQTPAICTASNGTQMEKKLLTCGSLGNA